MVELYKMDCNGKLYFCDYGLINKTEDYKLRGYIVRRAVPQAANRKPIVQRGRIINVHRMAKKESWASRFVSDVKHNVKVVKDIAGMFGSMFKTRETKAKEYFASKAVPAMVYAMA